MKQKYKDKGEISYRISHKGDTHVIVHTRIVNDFVIVRTFSFVYRDECSKTRMQHGYNWKFSLMFARFSPPGDPVRRSTRVYYVLNINTLRARGINRAVVVGGGDQPRYVRGTFGPGSPRYHLCQLSWCPLLPSPVMRRY